MAPPSYMWPVVDRNVVMWRRPVTGQRLSKHGPRNPKICAVISRGSTESTCAPSMTNLNATSLESNKRRAGLLARSQYPEGPATDHLDTRFSWFPCVYKRMLRWFPSFQVATTCLSCSSPNLNFLVTFFFSYLFTCEITTDTG
jgi:hypothetical protein